MSESDDLFEDENQQIGEEGDDLFEDVNQQIGEEELQNVIMIPSEMTVVFRLLQNIHVDLVPTFKIFEGK